MLIVDGHKLHFSEDMLVIFTYNNIEYASIPSHSSHLLQSLDRYFFSHMTRFYSKKSSKTNLLYIHCYHRKDLYCYRISIYFKNRVIPEAHSP